MRVVAAVVLVLAIATGTLAVHDPSLWTLPFTYRLPLSLLGDAANSDAVLYFSSGSLSSDFGLEVSKAQDTYFALGWNGNDTAAYLCSEELHSNADYAVAHNTAGSVSITDMYAVPGDNIPVADNVTAPQYAFQSGSWNSGLMRFEFRRDTVAADSRDVSINQAVCFMYAHGGYSAGVQAHAMTDRHQVVFNFADVLAECPQCSIDNCYTSGAGCGAGVCDLSTGECDCPEGFVGVGCTQPACDYSSCSDCLDDPGCGWCSATDTCTAGSVAGPDFDACAGENTNWRKGSVGCSYGQLSTQELLIIGVGGVSVLVIIASIAYMAYDKRRAKHMAEYRKQFWKESMGEAFTSPEDRAILASLQDEERRKAGLSPLPMSGGAPPVPAGEPTIKDPSEYKIVNQWNMEPVLRLVLFTYSPRSPHELPLMDGDMVTLLDDTGEEWWIGQVGEQVGYFPKTYVDQSVAAPSS